MHYTKSRTRHFIYYPIHIYILLSHSFTDLDIKVLILQVYLRSAASEANSTAPELHYIRSLPIFGSNSELWCCGNWLLILANFHKEPQSLHHDSKSSIYSLSKSQSLPRTICPSISSWQQINSFAQPPHTTLISCLMLWS